VNFRRVCLQEDLDAAQRWEEKQLLLAREAGADAAAHIETVRQMGAKKRAAAYETWGQGFYKNLENIAPLRGALAVWGLTVDDIAVGSFHGTSTKLNDRNEPEVVHKQMKHLGRTKPRAETTNT